MNRRHQKLERILAVQQQLHKMAELKLIDLHRQASALKEAQDTLVQAMNDHDALHGMFVDVMARRLQALAEQASRVDSTKATQKEITFERALQAKRTEKMVSNLQDEIHKVEEKRDLLAILDSFSTKADASFP